MQFEAQWSTFGCAGCIDGAGVEKITRPKVISDFVKTASDCRLLSREVTVVHVDRKTQMCQPRCSHDPILPHVTDCLTVMRLLVQDWDSIAHSVYDASEGVTGW